MSFSRDVKKHVIHTQKYRRNMRPESHNTRSKCMCSAFALQRRQLQLQLLLRRSTHQLQRWQHLWAQGFIRQGTWLTPPPHKPLGVPSIAPTLEGQTVKERAGWLSSWENSLGLPTADSNKGHRDSNETVGRDERGAPGLTRNKRTLRT